MNGIEIIAEARRHQLEDEGFTVQRDLQYVEHELPCAAVSYALAHVAKDLGIDATIPPENLWPWDKSWWRPSHDPIDNLAKAGALIAAEIDRIQLERHNNVAPN